MEFVHGALIKKSLNDVAPSRIAVAYIGKDWKDYVSASRIAEAIISPTLGSNPRAIEELAGAIGWHKLHFLDNLHTKLYLGAHAAAIGSFNLTANGLSAEGLEEAGMIVRDEAILQQMDELFARYKQEATAQHPTLEHKERKLASLWEAWRTAVSAGAITNDSQQRDIANFNVLANDLIYVVPVYGEMDYDEQLVGLPIRDSISFLESDELRANHWILAWPSREDASLDPKAEPYWLYMHELISGGAVHKLYTQAAIERKDRSIPAPPFDLTEKAINALSSVLRSGRFPAFLDHRTSPWSIQPTIQDLPAFMDALQAEYRQPAAHAIAPDEMLTTSVLPGNVLRSVKNPLLMFARKLYPQSRLQEVGKDASWAAHLILNQAGHTLDYRLNKAGESAASGQATTAWLLGRFKPGSTRQQRVLGIMEALSATPEFGPALQYWATHTMDRLG